MAAQPIAVSRCDRRQTVKCTHLDYRNIVTYIPTMTLGWLWFFLSLGLALMLAAAQQLAPTAGRFWATVFLAGAVLAAASLAAHLIRRRRD